MSRVFFDTNVFAYLFQDHPEFGPPTKKLWQRIQTAGDELYTSYLTLGEIQVKARNEGRHSEADKQAAGIIREATLVAFDRAATEAFVLYRCKAKVKAPDAMQLACAAASGAKFFVTNDLALLNARLPEIDMFIVTPQNAPL